MSRQEGFLG
jgi:hypothetical protein